MPTVTKTLVFLPPDADVDQYLTEAGEAGADEILIGIPAAYADEVGDHELPYVLEVSEELILPDLPAAPEAPADPDPLATMRADLDWIINYVITGES